LSKSKDKITGAFLGTIVEYYDYSLYGFSAGILATKFFPEGDMMTSLMYVFAIYSVAYIMKPLGSLFFSKIGDVYGRKISLSITMIGIAIPTLTIGLLPDYESIGATSTMILVICRLLQGFFIAGEYDGAAIYVIEHLGKKYHYTASAITRATGVVGLLLGIATTNLFNSSIFPEWGWRIPFLLSLPLALITIYYRQYLEETPDFKQNLDTKVAAISTWEFLKKQWRNLLLVILLAGSFGATYQIAIIFMKQYLPMVVPKTAEIITTVSIVMVFIFGISMPIAGILADKFGKIIVIKASLIGTIITVIVLSVAITNQMLNLVLISSLTLALCLAPVNALAHGLIVKAFPVNQRYRGVSLGHTTGSMLMSGSANYVCLLVMKEFDITIFPMFYVALFSILAYAVVARIASTTN
jgi:MFS transporter, MHS family, proline/betaine transporter